MLQRDLDEDGIGNGCDTDIDEDSDGVQDGRPDGGYRYFDNCRNLPNADQLDTDNDGMGKCYHVLPYKVVMVTSLCDQVMHVMMTMTMMGLMMMLITAPRCTIRHSGQKIVTMTVMLTVYPTTEMPAHAIKRFRWQTLTTSSPFH